MNATRDIIRHGAVLIDGDRIVEVGKSADLEARHPDATSPAVSTSWSRRAW